MNFETFDKVVCRIKIRPVYKGRKAKEHLLPLNGKVYLMEVLWQNEADEFYPAEYALAPYDKEERKEWYDKYDCGWIASGDVEFLGGAHGKQDKIRMISRGGTKPPAISIELKPFVEQGVETFVVCGESFAAYNKLISQDELQRIVDDMDQTESLSKLWRSEQEKEKK